jgi:hypothetical protein
MARFAQRSKQELHVQAGGLDATKTVLAPGSGRSVFLLTSPLIGHSERTYRDLARHAPPPQARGRLFIPGTRAQNANVCAMG